MMRVAFYAPLKPPDHPVPSGDRRIARELMRALALAGHQAVLASRFRSWDGGGDAGRQARIARLGAQLAQRLLRRYRARPESRPALWLTYHLYHKAPDWLGPVVTHALGIPYVVVEAAHSPGQAGGPWAAGHAAARAAIRNADLVVSLNSDDRDGLLALVEDPRRLVALPPFLDTAPYRRAARAREPLATRFDLDPSRPWLLTVAMMREGAKLASYRVLAAAARRLLDLEWQLVLVGDGPARGTVEGLFEVLPPGRARFLGALEAADLPPLYAAADLYLWPAIHEAFGMAFLEAQAAGLPAVAGRERGVPDIVRDGGTGLLAPPGDAAAFAAAVRALLTDADRRTAMSRRARELSATEHDIEAAAARLDVLLRRAAGRHGARCAG
jgi:glycosyltransferase involved in cell wall biosynthesis